MEHAAPQWLTVCSPTGRQTFAPGHDVVVGRDVRADVRIPHNGVSRSHVVVRHRDGCWVAEDDGSRHGMFVGQRRVSAVRIDSTQTVRLLDPDGPALTFDLATPAAPPAATQAETVTIGRAPDNDIVLPDVLAAPHHAALVATDRGVALQNTGGVVDTFVNGRRVTAAELSDDDVVTIGNVDLVFIGGSLVRRTRAAATTGGLEVRDASLRIENGVDLLDRVSFTARPGTLTAVIGPSGSGKSTLARVITGATRPTGGAVDFDGHDLHDGYSVLRSRIGMVPQDDIVHDRLTVDQALRFAAELRMPAAADASDRRRTIAEVLDELELTAHAGTRIEDLSGGQRKRVSVAMELLTGPTLLVLDEPTTGLDPALDRAVMTMLRRLADAGRVVVVVTHSLSFLDLCDQVLLVAPGGKTAYCGPPEDLSASVGAADWADVFTLVSADPDGVQQRFRAESTADAATMVQAVGGATAVADGTPPPAPRVGFGRQFAAVARRQVLLLTAHRQYLLFLAALPFIVGLLPLTVAGDAGLAHLPGPGAPPFEAKHLVALISFAAILMGTTLTARDLVGERRIFRREQAAGLSASAYLLAKVAIFGAVAALQAVVLVAIVTAPSIGKPGPSGAAAVGLPWLELCAGVAATAVVAAVMGLAVSAVARTGDQVIVLLAVVLMTQLVFAGGFIPVTGRPLFETIAWVMPGRWGFSATASTVDLTALVTGIADDAHWHHTASAWWFAMGMLGLLALVFAGITRWRLRLR